MLKKLFGGIDLSWSKLILLAVVAGLYAGVMFSLPFTLGTSFMDIAVGYEWWILFAVIIMVNSKSPMDSALKCSAFFAISQPIIYLIQISFSRESFEFSRLMLYGGWIYISLLVLPLAYIGHYMKKRNAWSLLILSPVFILLTISGVGYLRQAINSFPHHLLSAVFCFVAIIIIALGVCEEKRLRSVLLSCVGVFLMGYVIFFGGIIAREAIMDLSEYGIYLNENSSIPYASYYPTGDGKIVKDENGNYKLKIVGYRSGKCYFTLATDKLQSSNYVEYHVECGFDIMGNFVVYGVDR